MPGAAGAGGGGGGGAGGASEVPQRVVPCLSTVFFGWEIRVPYYRLQKKVVPGNSPLSGGPSQRRWFGGAVGFEA